MYIMKKKLFICYRLYCEIYFFLRIQKIFVFLQGCQNREHIDNFFYQYLAYERNYCTNMNIYMYNIYSHIYIFLFHNRQCSLRIHSDIHVYSLLLSKNKLFVSCFMVIRYMQNPILGSCFILFSKVYKYIRLFRKIKFEKCHSLGF